MTSYSVYVDVAAFRPLTISGGVWCILVASDILGSTLRLDFRCRDLNHKEKR